MARSQPVIAGYISYILFSASLLVSQIGKYQNNVYEVVPIWGWIAFCSSLGIGTLLWYNGVKSSSKNQLLHSSIILLITFGNFWFFARLIGLPFWSAPRADLLQHYGQSIAIVETGHILSNNVYPALHVLLATLNLISRIDYGALGPILSFTYYTLLIIGVALVVRRISNGQIAGYVLFASIPLYFDKYTHHLMPWMAYFSLIPLLILLILQYKSESEKEQQAFTGLAVLLLASGMVVGHPMSSLIGISVIAIFIFSKTIVGSWTRNNSNETLAIRPVIVAPILIAYPIWYLSRVPFRRFLKIMIASVTTSGLEGTGQLASRAGTSGYTPQQLVTEYLIGKWGPTLVVLSLSLPIAAIITHRLLSRKGTSNEGYIITLYGAGGILGAIMLMGDFIAKGPTRINQITIVAGTVLIGVAIWWVTESNKTALKQVCRIALIAFILLGVITTPFAIYNESQYVMESEFSGAKHHLQHSDWSRTTYSQSMSVVLPQYLLGSHRSPHYTERVFQLDDNQTPKYLGYAQNETFEASVSDENFYLITKQRDIKWWHQEPPNRYQYINYYTSQNLIQAKSDPSLNEIYANGRFSIWSSK